MPNQSGFPDRYWWIRHMHAGERTKAKITDQEKQQITELRNSSKLKDTFPVPNKGYEVRFEDITGYDEIYENKSIRKENVQEKGLDAWGNKNIYSQHRHSDDINNILSNNIKMGLVAFCGFCAGNERNKTIKLYYNEFLSKNKSKSGTFFEWLGDMSFKVPKERRAELFDLVKIYRRKNKGFDNLLDGIMRLVEDFIESFDKEKSLN